MRVVTHLNVTAEQADTAAEILVALAERRAV
jgi:hypothetical protein